MEAQRHLIRVAHYSEQEVAISAHKIREEKKVCFDSFDILEDELHFFIIQLKFRTITDIPKLLLRHESLRDYMSPDSSENELALHILFHELIVDKDMFGVEELLRTKHANE
ncbi:uncharacterized protein PHALS_00582 [Plasmopara halstedii]|uniref:Uncharacterized protein n=1 Tax=Plasmopara halstedii TaxID=4781 RepID=A0A0P1ASN7_PLAHL|nr:uncharacterized protein PHALS_00582 [Plasmopara halstedii]CEG44295.1 hypothetical protein PHALS_00582 [Plasmopara halstedii]|eukprot:XP_024580664.1 hypothetical protein PHALS_00582 [Plasmopara halstedii]